MFSIIAVTCKVGILFAFGWIIDLMLEEDGNLERTRNKLNQWRLMLDRTHWFDVGHQEAKSALAIFDHLFGDRFWSWRRAFGTLALLIGSVLLAAVLCLPDLLPSSNPIDAWRVDAFLWRTVVQLLTMALSLSATRWLTTKVMHLRGYASILGFFLMLLLSLLLIEVWSPIANTIKGFPPGLILNPLSLSSLCFQVWHTLVTSEPWSLRQINPERLFQPLSFAMRYNFNGYIDIVGGLGIALSDYIVSMFRILFYSFFVFCFILRRFVHRPLVRLGRIWLTSGNPIFATLFAAVATIVVGIQELKKVL